MRATWVGLAVLAGALAPIAHAEPAVDDAAALVRRTHDLFGFETNIDNEFGHNHLHLQLWDHREEPYARWRADIGFGGEVRATVRYVDGGGVNRVRRFSTITREAYEPFAEEPVVSPYIYEGVMFALPHDFGGVSATVDLWVALDDIEETCPPPTEPGPCGGAVEGFFNHLGTATLNLSGIDEDDARSESVTLL